MSVRFIETQRFAPKAQAFMLLQTALIMAFLGFMLLHPAAFHLPIHGGPPSTWVVVPLLLLFLVLAAWLLRAMFLQVTVDEKEVRIRFSPYKPLVVPLDGIDRVEPLTYRAILDCGGHGMRRGYKLKGRSFCVSGDQGVEIVTRDGKIILVGTQRQAELLKALQNQ